MRSCACDRLTLGVCLYLLLRNYSGAAVNSVYVLNHESFPLVQVFWAKVLGCAGIKVSFEEFQAATLRGPNGIAPTPDARASHTDISVEAAQRALERYPYMRSLNGELGRNSIKLLMIKYYSGFAFHGVLHAKCAIALAHARGETLDFILLNVHPGLVDCGAWQKVAPCPIRPFASLFASCALWFNAVTGRAWQTVGLLRKLWRWRTQSSSCCKGLPLQDAPSLLTLMEDEVSLDRSYRGQPHWLLEEEGIPAFQTIIWSETCGSAVEAAAMEHYGVFVKTEDELMSAPAVFPTPAFKGRLLFWYWRVLLTSLVRGFTSAGIGHHLCQALATGVIGVELCRRYAIRGFYSCDTYFMKSDVMSLVMQNMGRESLAVQYSNLRFSSVLMTNTMDSACIFSDLYAGCFNVNDIGPRTMIKTGYPYGAAFGLVSERASQHRKKLRNAGAEFVVCYYDENVIDTKYSVYPSELNVKSYNLLLGMIIQDPSLGVVVKTQFGRNQPKKFIDEKLRKEALATGRYLELISGEGRNNIFPCEAALAADISVGEYLGGTASLEAALCGGRSLLVNPFGATGLADELYVQANVLYPSLSIALEAIMSARLDGFEASNLGDWTPIIQNFDPYNDGSAARRLRVELEKLCH